MASLSGTYGSRKSISSLPILTGKGAHLIYTNLCEDPNIYNQHTFYEEYAIPDRQKDPFSLVLLGILFEGLVNEDNINVITYDCNYLPILDSDSVETRLDRLKMYLQKNFNISGDQVDSIIEESLDAGFLKESPPFNGYIIFTNPKGRPVVTSKYRNELFQLCEELSEKTEGFYKLTDLGQKLSEYIIVYKYICSAANAPYPEYCSHTWYEILYNMAVPNRIKINLPFHYLYSDQRPISFFDDAEKILTKLIETGGLKLRGSDEILLAVKIIDERCLLEQWMLCDIL